MATIFQVIELYRRILDYLLPLERGILGRGGSRFLENGGDFDLDGSRSDYMNGRFFYTGLGSERRGGGYVHVESEKIRGDGFTRNTGGVLGLGRVSAADGFGSVRSFGGVLGVGGARGILDFGGASGFDGVRTVGSRRDMSNWSAWNVGNYWNWGMENTSKPLAAVNDLSAVSTANTASTINAAGKKNASEYRLGVVLEKQINGRQILGANDLASIDRSLGITGRGFSVMGGIRELWGDLNGFSQKIKTGGTLRTQNAFSENKSLSELGRIRNAVSAKRAAASTIDGLEENAEMPAAIRGFSGGVGRESGMTARLGFSGGRDADELIDRLCGALSEAASSMAEGVHY